ncbi:Peptidyl-tRNA hydrolase protein 2, mitochondrial [Dinochytrium kinnereticum]|nr:Peptidyl-tRNA hydrolase protein 2, mitochondrial [Dinochytrium kinnereticum]
MDQPHHFEDYHTDSTIDVDLSADPSTTLPYKIYQFLTEPSFTGLHIVSACLTSFIFALVAIPLFFPSAPVAVAGKTADDVGEEVKDVEEKSKEETKGLTLDGPASPLPKQLSKEKSNVEWKLVSDRVLGHRWLEPCLVLVHDLDDAVGELWEQILCVRTDLEMGKGKVAAQCCHATLAAYNEMMQRDPEGLKRWERHGQPKITLKCPSEDELIKLQQKAQSLGIVAKVIRDAGRTQIAPGSKTVLAVGPAPKDRVDEVTGHLKLY